MVVEVVVVAAPAPEQVMDKAELPEGRQVAGVQGEALWG